MKKLVLLLCMVCAFSSYAQNSKEADIKAINKVLKNSGLLGLIMILMALWKAIGKVSHLNFMGQTV